MTVAATLLFDRTLVANAADLISKFSDSALASPFRSTVPLITLAKDDWPTFRKVLDRCGIAAGGSVAFERTVRSPRGEGRPSHTDAMAVSESLALAIEAKWTEPRYETVAKRLMRKDSEGQKSSEFVTGWLDLLQPHATKPLKLDAFANSVYQVLHRSASACGECQTPRLPRLAYLHFTPAPPSAATSEQYLRDLSDFHVLLGSPKDFPFFVVDLPIEPTPAFHAIQELKKGDPMTGTLVRAALLRDVLFEFGEPKVRVIPAPN